MADHLAELKRLARANPAYVLINSRAAAINSLMSVDEVPEFLVPMRDVWISGTRLKGVRPVVTVTDRQVIVITYSSRWRPPKYFTFNRRDIAAVSDYSDRGFEMTIANGQTVKMQGLIGGKAEDTMPLHLYELLSKE